MECCATDKYKLVAENNSVKKIRCGCYDGSVTIKDRRINECIGRQ